jgi:hypothetical protein
MVVKHRHIKNIPFTDEEINRYCQSVEKLLIKIKEDSLIKKRKKRRAAQVEYIKEEEDNLVLS